MTHPLPDRRGRQLTDADIDELMRRLDAAWQQNAENIGYDITTPLARSEIREDHAYVRSLRLGTARAKIAAWGAGISVFVGTALWLFWEALVRAVTRGGA